MLITLLLFGACRATTQPGVTTPFEQFGHEIGADSVLPNYAQLAEYWRKLARESDRLVLDTIGATAGGRAQLMAIITAPKNHRRLDRYREIARRLALAENLSEDDARALAREGRAVVWIDGGLHATEILTAQQLIETVFQLVSRRDVETVRILEDVIVLAVHANPDGHDLVANWYVRDPALFPDRKALQGSVPTLIQEYIGSHNNRDFFALTQPETRNMSRVLYHEWFPQIVHNPHQNSPPGTVMWVPPYVEPHNPHVHPLMASSIEIVGAAMMNRFIIEKKAGVTTRKGGRDFSTWWNGGLRTTPYFHNMIGIMTETIGHASPIEIPFDADRQQPWGDLPQPIEPRRWSFRQSVDYLVTANYAILDIASKRREDWLFNIYRMGRDAIERGSRDSWTVHPDQLDETRRRAAVAASRSGSVSRRADLAMYESQLRDVLRDPARRDARGYIIPSDQPDFLTATKFVNALRQSGVAVQRAVHAFEVAGTRYPGGSYVVRTAQAFGPHVLDMFEPQEYPDRLPHPRASVPPPYDMAGWTLAFQMGVRFDRVLEAFDGPFEYINEPEIRPAPGRVAGGNPAGYLLSHELNDAFLAINRVLRSGGVVYELRQRFSVAGRRYPAGTFFIAGAPATRSVLGQLSLENGLTFDAAPMAPPGEHRRLSPVRVALWDRYGGHNGSGALRWALEQFEFPVELIYAQQLDAGELDGRFDVLVLPAGSVPARSGVPAEEPRTAGIPVDLHRQLGNVTVEKTMPRIRSFLEGGGTVVAIGTSAANAARHLQVPVRSHLVERGADGTERAFTRTEFQMAGSVVRARVDTAASVGRGLPENVDFVLVNSPVFRLEATDESVRPLAWFETRTPLRSGWIRGQHQLDAGVILAQAEVGRGMLYLFAPEIAHRAQPHGTFRFLFNAIVSADAETAVILSP